MHSRSPWTYERGALWTMEIDRDVLHPAPQLVAATFAEVPEGGMAALTSAMGLLHSSPLAQRFGAGSRCFVAWVPAGIAAYGWVSEEVERIGELERPFHMQPGEAYIWDCATLPPYRRLGLYRALLHHITRVLGHEGKHRLWIGASVGNRASMRGMAAVGFQPVIKTVYFRLFNLRHVWMSDYPGTARALVTQARRGLLAAGG